MQAIALGVLAAGGWYLWKVLKREMSRIDREIEAARGKPDEHLVHDPETGRYTLHKKQ